MVSLLWLLSLSPPLSNPLRSTPELPTLHFKAELKGINSSIHSRSTDLLLSTSSVLRDGIWRTCGVCLKFAIWEPDRQENQCKPHSIPNAMTDGAWRRQSKGRWLGLVARGAAEVTFQHHQDLKHGQYVQPLFPKRWPSQGSNSGLLYSRDSDQGPVKPFLYVAALLVLGLNGTKNYRTHHKPSGTICLAVENLGFLKQDSKNGVYDHSFIGYLKN